MHIYIGCSHGDIRLVSYSNLLQGRVEVCYDGVWGTVCDRQWNNANAAVACRQLGYSSSGKLCLHRMIMLQCIFISGAVARLDAVYRQGTGPILLSNVQCSGNEQRLFECQHNSLDVGSCRHTEDAGVDCFEGIGLAVLTCNSSISLYQGCTEGELRLVGGTTGIEGRVEICFSDEWGTVCDQMWDDTDASVVCRQLKLHSTGM